MASLTFYLPTVIFISLVGGFLPLLRELSQKGLALLLSFSAGVLLGAVFFHMFNELCNRRWHKATAFASEKSTSKAVFADSEISSNSEGISKNP
jgi:peptidoglycan/LPS O-acetylase OafA/YrhL